MKPIIATALVAVTANAGALAAAELNPKVLNFPAADEIEDVETLTDRQIRSLNQLVHSGASPGEINTRITAILD